MTIERIKGHESAQVKVYKYDNGAVTLVSYTTAVIGINAEGWMEVSGLYSRTTIKHQLAKRLYMENMRFNIHTGEIENRG